MKKKKTRRSKQKHPDLLPEFNLKTRSDLLDQDYLHKLNDKELDWLNKFNKEYVNASLDSNPKKNLHNSKKLIKNVVTVLVALGGIAVFLTKIFPSLFH